jgi:DNA-binding winged helix-turn-helix (wHTH) protein
MKLAVGLTLGAIIGERDVLHFPPFRLDLVEERLWKGEREVQLAGKPFAILRYLAHRPRRLVTRSEIVEAVWGRRVAMSGSLLRSHMHNLRRALGEAVIETVIGRGYRFMVTVSDADDGSPGRRDCEVADSTAHARLLEQLVDALAGLGLSERVLLVIGDETRARRSVSVEDGAEAMEVTTSPLTPPTFD